MFALFLRYGLLACLVCVGAAILFPTGSRSRHNARRASCQSNEKQIGLALRMYAADYDDHLPIRAWAAPLVAYAKTDRIFQCPETSIVTGTSDYFFNARFLSRQLGTVKAPGTLALLGDGPDNAPLNATLSQFPDAWRKDETSPAFRNLNTANYLFADGHVKSLKVKSVPRDFRMVQW